MKTTRSCPACNQSIFFLSGISSPTPFSVKCPHCKAEVKIRLPYLKISYVFLIILFILLALKAAAIYNSSGFSYTFLLFVSAIILFWFTLEIVVGILLFSYGNFTIERSS